MLKKSLLGLGTLAAFFALIVFLQPDEFRVSRTVTVAAPASAAFAQVNSFHAWQTWSPWAKLDPNAKAAFAGNDAGEGAVFLWSGNSDVGEGKMTIVESRPHERIGIRLDFVKPMEATSDVQFTFQPNGETTDVTWTMSGQNNFLGKAVCLFMNQDKMIGGYFEKGLASLKMRAEASAFAKQSGASP